jgi:hypothetical protein
MPRIGFHVIALNTVQLTEKAIERHEHIMRRDVDHPKIML